MHEYLFHRASHCPSPDTPPDLLADDVFFHQWTTRQHPFNEIESGDRLWWVDKQSREIRWELRAVEVLKQPYNSPTEALGMLRRAYGLIPDQLNDYFVSASPNGWLLAFAVEVMQPLAGVRLPDEERLARNGLRTITPELRAELEVVGLPAPATVALAKPSGPMNADAVTSLFIPNPTRHVPSSVKAEVWERSGEKCQQCGRAVDRGEIHFDHHIPFSRGGPSTVENLRVLCAPCNLSKGAKMPPRAGVRTFDEPVADLAAVLGRHQPRSVDDLVVLLADASHTGELDAARSALLALYRDPEFDDDDLNRCIDAISESAGLDDLVALLRLHDQEDRADGLRSLLSCADEAVRLEAGLELCAEDGLGADEALPILLTALAGPDRYLADCAVIVAAQLPGLEEQPAIPPIESLLNSPVYMWRSTAALVLAEQILGRMLDGDIADGDSSRFFELCDVALASPIASTAHEAAFLLAQFWSVGKDDNTRRWAAQYLDFAGSSDDPELLAEVEELRKELQPAK